MTSPGGSSLKDSEGNRNLLAEQDLVPLIPVQASTSDQPSQGMPPETHNSTDPDKGQTLRGAESNVRPSIVFNLSITHNVL